MNTSFDADQVWEDLLGVLSFGDRLDFVFLDCESAAVREQWRAALQKECERQGLPWRETASDQTFLEWLEAERMAGLTASSDSQSRPERTVYFGVIPEEQDERVTFARMNENRDNLVRAMSGVLLLAGEGDFARRLAYAAPSIWAMRTAGFDLRGPPPQAVRSEAGARGAPKSEAEKREESFELDAFLSTSARDEPRAVRIASMLQEIGLRCRWGSTKDEHAQMDKARAVVVVLSASYAYSEAAESLSESLARRPQDLRAKLIPIALEDGTVPGALRDLESIDFRASGAEIESVAKLAQRIQGRREGGAGPGLPALKRNTWSTSGFVDVAAFWRRASEIQRRVCLIEVDGAPAGTGFLVGSDMVLTSYSVITDGDGEPRGSEIGCRFDVTGSGTGTVHYRVRDGGVLLRSPWSPRGEGGVGPPPNPEHLDFALLRVDGAPGQDRGFVQVPAKPYEFQARTPVLIVQHPSGGSMKLSMDTEGLVGLNENGTRVRYRTNTQPGSSGAPCFNASWRLIAMHHARDKWGYGQGIPIHLIYEQIKGFLES